MDELVLSSGPHEFPGFLNWPPVQYPDTPPIDTSTPSFQEFIRIVDVLSHDPTVNALYDNANYTIHLENGTVITTYDFSNEDLLNALFSSASQGQYEDNAGVTLVINALFEDSTYGDVSFETALALDSYFLSIEIMQSFRINASIDRMLVEHADIF